MRSHELPDDVLSFAVVVSQVNFDKIAFQCYLKG